MAELSKQDQIAQLSGQIRKMQEQIEALRQQMQNEAATLEKPPELHAQQEIPAAKAESGNPVTDPSRTIIEQLAAIQDTVERARAIRMHADIAAAVTGGNAGRLAEGLTGKVDAMIAEHSKAAPSLYVTQFNSAPGAGQVYGGVTIGKDGVSGSFIGGQVGVFESDRYGAGSAFGQVGISAKGEASAASGGVKYVSPPVQAGDVSGVGIGVLSVSTPAHDQAFDASKIGVTVGAAAWHDQTGLSTITTLRTDAAGESLVGGLSLSANIFQGGNTRVALNTHATRDFVNDATGVGGGLMAKTRLGHGFSPWIGVDGGVNDVGNRNDPTVSLNVGVNFGENPAPAPTHEQSSDGPGTAGHAEFSAAVSKDSVPAADVTAQYGDVLHTTNPQPEKPVGHDELAEMRAKFHGLSEEGRSMFLDRVSRNFAENTGADPAMAKEYLAERLMAKAPVQTAEEHAAPMHDSYSR